MSAIISIGDLAVSFQLFDGLHVNAGTPIAAFAASTQTGAISNIAIRLGPTSSSHQPLLFDSGGVWRATRAETGHRFEFAVDGRVYKSAELARDLSRGVVTIDGAFTGPDPDPFEYPFDELLFNHLLARHGGIEVHAIGIIDEGRGILCVGHSGAGKSTMGRLWGQLRPAATVLSDDRIIIRRDASGYRIWGTPWHGEAKMSAQGSAPLDRIMILRQDSENAARRLAPLAAAAELLSRSFYPVYLPDAVLQAMEFVASLVDHVPICELRFRRDTGAVESVLSC